MKTDVTICSHNKCCHSGCSQYVSAQYVLSLIFIDELIKLLRFFVFFMNVHAHF